MAKDSVSEAASKKKRGRPRLIHPKLEFWATMLWGDARSHQHVLNGEYYMRALDALKEKENGDLPKKYRWLVEPRPKITLLAELGRITDEEWLRGWARGVCRSKPKVKDAIAVIRNWRLHPDQR